MKWMSNIELIHYEVVTICEHEDWNIINNPINTVIENEHRTVIIILVLHIYFIGYCIIM